MVTNPDHASFVVEDVDAAIDFFTLLGFEKTVATVITGEVFERYMGVPGLRADHVTLVLKGCEPRFDIELLRYHQPEAIPSPHIRDLNRIGFNHIAFAVDDLDADVSRLRAAGVRLRNEVLDYHGRKIVFVEGPEGITVELAQWD